MQVDTDRRRHLAPSTRARTIDALRFLFRFLHTIGYLPCNVALPVQVLAAAWRTRQALGRRAPADPVRRSRAGGHLFTEKVWRIVRKAARDAGTLAEVSPHFRRHAYASHAMDRGAPIHRVQQTLGHANLQTTSKCARAKPNDSGERYPGPGEF